jgi:hypothetical protein
MLFLWIFKFINKAKKGLSGTIVFFVFYYFAFFFDKELFPALGSTLIDALVFFLRSKRSFFQSLFYPKKKYTRPLHKEFHCSQG